MRFLDFRFNGLVIEPVIEFGNLDDKSKITTMQNIKQIGEAKRLALALDIAIKAMEKKEKEDAYASIFNLEEKQKQQANAAEQLAQQVSHLKGEYFTHYSEHYTSSSPSAAEQT